MDMCIIKTRNDKPPGSINDSSFVGSTRREISLVVPTAIMVSPLTAIASAIGFSLSMVRTFPFIITRSAFSMLSQEPEMPIIIMNK